MTKIFTVDALAAAGKTFASIKYVTAQVRGGERFIITVPSIKLMDQVKIDYEKAGCARIIAYHSEDGSPETVSSRLTRHFKDCTHDVGEIVLVTFAAFERLPYIERRADWHLIIDEVPQIVFHERFSLLENRDKLLELFTEVPFNAAYTMLHASETDTGHVDDVAKNRFKDRVTAQFKDVSNKLLSDHWNVYAQSCQLETFRTVENTENAIDVFGILRPSIIEGFKSVTLMGACLTDSILYRHWLAIGIEFEPHPGIKPRFTKYPNANLVTVQYVIERAWSGKLRDGTQPDGRRNIDHIAERCLEALGDRPYVYLLNKDDPLKPENGVALPHAVYGLNSYQGFHNAMVLSALNPPPAYFGFVADFIGMDSEETRTAIYRQAAFQAAARISLRDIDDRHAKVIQVADRDTAYWLADLIGTSRIEKLAGPDLVAPDLRERDMPKSGVERVQQHRANKKAKLLAGLEEVNTSSPALTASYIIEDSVSAAEGWFGGSIWSDVYAKSPLDQIGPVGFAGFVEFLRDLHSRELNKGEEMHISPAIFAKGDKRAISDIQKMWGVWLDCDDATEITPEKFSAIFPHVKFVAYSTAGCSADKMKYRLAIPTTHAMSAEAYAEIQLQIREILRKRGYYDNDAIKDRRQKDPQAKASGFDRKHTASMYALPVQPVAGAEQAFFEVSDGPTRKPIDPFVWIDRTIIDHRPMAEPISKEFSVDEWLEILRVVNERTEAATDEELEAV
jgi:hypothetical protein